MTNVFNWVRSHAAAIVTTILALQNAHTIGGGAEKVLGGLAALFSVFGTAS